MKMIDGVYVRVKHYFARKEDLVNAYFSNSALTVVGIYPNGDVTHTKLLGYIVQIRLGLEPGLHMVTTSENINGNEVPIYVL